MIKYAYEIHCYYSLGEIYDYISSWYTNMDYCENNCLKKINSKKFKEELIENGVYDGLKLDIYIVTNEKENNLLQMNNFTEYIIIKRITNQIIYPDRDNETFDFEENIQFFNICKEMKEIKHLWRKLPEKKVINKILDDIKNKFGFNPNEMWVETAYMLKLNPMELMWRNFEDFCEFRAELADKLHLTQKDIYELCNKISDIEMIAINMHITDKLKNEMINFINE